MKPYISKVIFFLKQGNAAEVWALLLQIPILFIYNNLKEITYLSINIHVWI